MLPICRRDEEMDKVHSLSGENLKSGYERGFSGKCSIRSVFTNRTKAKMSSDYRGIKTCFIT